MPAWGQYWVILCFVMFFVFPPSFTRGFQTEKQLLYTHPPQGFLGGSGGPVKSAPHSGESSSKKNIITTVQSEIIAMAGAYSLFLSFSLPPSLFFSLSLSRSPSLPPSRSLSKLGFYPPNPVHYTPETNIPAVYYVHHHYVRPERGAAGASNLSATHQLCHSGRRRIL